MFDGAPTKDPDFEQLLHDMDQHIYQRAIQNETKFTMLFDTENLGFPSPTYQLKLGRWVRAKAEESKAYLLGSAVVVTNPIVRVFIKGVFLVCPPSAPMSLVSDLEQAQRCIKWIP